MVNWIGVGNSILSLIKPNLLIPRLIIPDISHLNWLKLKQNGVTGIIIDKDNCITKPGEDSLVPALNASWENLLSTFGSSNVLIVSNSAGTNKDSILLQAESVSRNLKVPVLIHPIMKPGKECALSAITYFSNPNPTSSPPSSAFIKYLKSTLRIKSKSPRGSVVWSNRVQSQNRFPVPSVSSAYSSTTSSTSPQIQHQLLLVIGDRLATDIILAHKLTSLSGTTLTINTNTNKTKSKIQIKAIPILTATLHSPEKLGTTLLRSLEGLILRLMRNSEKSLRFRKEGPWDECLNSTPLAASTSFPSESLPTSSSLSTRLLLASLPPLINLSTKTQSAFNYQSEWNYKNKLQNLFKGTNNSNGIESYAEKLVDGTEDLLEKGKEELRRRLGREVR